MDGSSEDKVDIMLRLGNLNLSRTVPFSQKDVFVEAERLFNDYFSRMNASPMMRGNERLTLSVLALQFAVQYIELRNSKADNVLAPEVEKALGDIEEALERLEEKQ